MERKECSLFRETPARKTNVLKLEMSGRFAINIVDSLVIVHHQASKVCIYLRVVNIHNAINVNNDRLVNQKDA